MKKPDSRWSDDKEETKKASKKAPAKTGLVKVKGGVAVISENAKVTVKKGDSEMKKVTPKKKAFNHPIPQVKGKVAPKKAAPKKVAKKETAKKVTTKKAVPRKKDEGLTHLQRWDKRWEEFVKANKPEVLRVTNHRKLPDGRELFKLDVVAGYQVRLYKDETYKSFKMLVETLVGREAIKVYSQFKEDEYDLPMVGVQVTHGKLIDRLNKPAKKATTKKPAAKKVTKKASAKKTAAKKTPKKAAKKAKK